MQIEFKLKRILPVFLGLIVLWGFFITSSILLSGKENPNHNYVPENSSFVLQFDGKMFIESAVYSLLLKSPDQEIFKQLKSLANQEQDFAVNDSGIDFFSDVIVFGQTHPNGQLIGVIFNQMDAQKFDKNMSGRISDNQSFASNKEVGILLTFIPESQGKNIDKKAISQLAKEVLLHKNASKSVFKETGKESFMALNLFKENNQFGAGSIESQINGSLLSFQGDFNISRHVPVSSWSLKPDGFHLTNKLFNRQLQDSIQKLLLSQGFDLPLISGIAVNYRGTEIVAGSIAPQAEFLIEFTAAFDAKQIYENTESWKKLGYRPVLVNNELILSMGETSYTVTVLDEKTLFVGLKKQNILHQNNENLFLLKGDLTQLTTIKGGDLIALSLNFYPPYRAGKQFFESVSVAEIKFFPKKGKLVLDGKIQFKEGKYPINEILKMLLTAQS